jgi:hypothetical protein
MTPHDLAYEGKRWCGWCEKLCYTWVAEFGGRVWRECPNNHKLTKAYKKKEVYKNE